MAKRLLTEKGAISFQEIRIDQDDAMRDKMIKLTNRTTVPQIFIGEIHVGGFDDLSKLNREGKLDALLQD